MADDFEMTKIFEEVSSILSEIDRDDAVIRDAVSAMLTDEEVDTLILGFAIFRGEEGFTTEEAQELLDWAVNVRVKQTMLDLALKKMTLPNVVPGDVNFRLSKEAEFYMIKRIQEESYGKDNDSAT